MSIVSIITDKDFRFHRITSLVALMIAIFLILISAIIPLVHNYLENIFIDLSIILIPELILAAIWQYHRSNYPKSKNDKSRIVIAITTEDIKQKTRLTKDFAKKIESQLERYKLDNVYEVLVLHNHLAYSLQLKIAKWAKLRNSGITEANKAEFNIVSNRMNSKLTIYGDLIVRNAPDNTYAFSIDAILRHNPVHKILSSSMQKEFNSFWKREIRFLEKDELNGFQESAHDVFFAATYMLGLATFVDNQYDKGILICDTLLTYIETKPDLSKHRLRIKQLKAGACLLKSILLYQLGEYEEGLKYRKMYHAILPNEYDSLLSEAINLVKIENNANGALDCVEKAKELAEGDCAWLYSKFYLLLKLKKHEQALEVLDEILSKKHKNEADVVQQVINYNTYCVKEDKEHTQSLFILGVMHFKKQNNPPQAYEWIDKFIQHTEKDESWNIVRTRAISYKTELDEIMGL